MLRLRGNAAFVYQRARRSRSTYGADEISRELTADFADLHGFLNRMVSLESIRENPRNPRSTRSPGYFPLNLRAPFFASTWMVWPSRTLPSRMSMLSGSRISFWIVRLSGRAP